VVRASIIKRLIALLFINIVVLSLPWLNAMTSDFDIKGELPDRRIHVVGSRGRFIAYSHSATKSKVISTGYYASIFNTLYAFKLNSKKYESEQKPEFGLFLREHQTLFVAKLKHLQNNTYFFKTISADPKLGVIKVPVILDGTLGLLSN